MCVGVLNFKIVLFFTNTIYIISILMKCKITIVFKGRRLVASFKKNNPLPLRTFFSHNSRCFPNHDTFLFYKGALLVLLKCY